MSGGPAAVPAHSLAKAPSHPHTRAASERAKGAQHRAAPHPPATAEPPAQGTRRRAASLRPWPRRAAGTQRAGEGRSREGPGRARAGASRGPSAPRRAARAVVIGAGRWEGPAAWPSNRRRRRAGWTHPVPAPPAPRAPRAGMAASGAPSAPWAPNAAPWRAGAAPRRGGGARRAKCTHDAAAPRATPARAARAASTPPPTPPRPPRPRLSHRSRWYCPYPGCKRSFAELWRLKVHYRAPPDVRGSGRERGHGTELTHCPKCGKGLKPGKHHVGCAAGRTAPRQASKRSRSVSRCVRGGQGARREGPRGQRRGGGSGAAAAAARRRQRRAPAAPCGCSRGVGGGGCAVGGAVAAAAAAQPARRAPAGAPRPLERPHHPRSCAPRSLPLTPRRDP
jgi:hypothetical protein